MGHRLSRIYTRTGDDGSTGLGDGVRVAKDDARVEAFGSVDEVNSVVGMILAEPTVPPAVRAGLEAVQHDLFDVGGELCMPGFTLVDAARVARIERLLDEWNGPLPPLKEFILPGGGRAAAACHLARTVCRRAERRIVALSRGAELNPELVRYVNRLSDLLFVAARVLARAESGSEVLWRGAEPPT